MLLAACAAPERAPSVKPMSAAEGRALVARYIPARISDREGWAADIYGPFASLRIEPSPANICAAIAVIEQESGWQSDPAVPNLPKAARQEIDALREKAAIPRLAVTAALALPSTDGRSYDQRLEDVRTERELSELFEEIIGRVPLGTRLLSERNPVRTGGPMQVSIAYARTRSDSYPYPVGTIRHEVFTRRGGIFFGIAHLLDYPAPYEDLLYRYADFNAGHYASRNAAFQRALAEISGAKLDLDGDLLRYEDGAPAKAPSATELATRSIGKRLRLDDGDIRGDLERGREARFGETRLYQRLFELADDRGGKRAARAVLPGIELKSSKFTRKLTTEWFARRVAERHKACLARGRG